MNVVERYKSAREIYKKVGVDTDLAIRKLLNFPISMHCWQGDDVVGFDGDVGRKSNDQSGYQPAECDNKGWNLLCEF